MQIVYTWLGKNYDKADDEIFFFFFFVRKMDDEIVVHYSVLYAFNGSEAGPLIWWQMH